MRFRGAELSDAGPERLGGKRRILVAMYVTMGIAVAVVAAVVFSAGQGLKAEKTIAGGYDLAKPDPCLGARVDLRQSGQFVNIENADGSIGGCLTMGGRSILALITAATTAT